MTAPDVTELQAALLAEVSAADSLDALEAVRVSALGKKGRITDQMKGLGQLDGDARKEAGQALNRVKDAVQEAITSRQADLDAVAAQLNERLPGHTLGEMRILLEGEIRDLRSKAKNAYFRAADLGLRAFAISAGDEADLVITTRSALLSQPEFNDPNRTRAIFEAVEANRRLLDVIGRVLEEPGDDVSVSLGEELEELGLGDCALVAVPYGAMSPSGAGPSRGGAGQEEAALGVLGVIGPNRMDYGRVIPLVSYCSRLVTEKLMP